MFVSILLLSIVLLLLIEYLWIIHRSYNYFRDRSIPSPPHRFFFGHYKTLWSTERFSVQLREWTREYGSIYGLYEGTRPLYIVSDVNFLHEVFIKQFSLFHSRRVPFLARMGVGTPENLFGSSGKTWRRQRRIVNPTFSKNRIQSILPILHQSIDIFINKLHEQFQRNEQLNIYQMYKRLTMDMMWRSAFGIESDMQNDEENLYLKKSSQVIEINFDRLWIVQLNNLMPFLQPFLIRYFLIQLKVIRWFNDRFPSLSDFVEELAPFWIIHRAEQVLNYRQSNAYSTKRNDLLQMMIDAQLSDEESKSEIFSSDEQKKLHRDEIVGNMLIFIIAGYETTATTLAYATFILATKRDIQEKLFQEINSSFHSDKETNDEENGDLLKNLSYLDLFLREVLRMYPIIIHATSRECYQNTNVCGHPIDKGSVIQADILTIHYDRDLWGPEDPMEFYPERHLIERHPVAWMPFGIGPRNCIGMRLALIELKTCLTRLLREYEILPGEDLHQYFQLKETSVIHPQAIFIRLKQRHITSIIE